ncbi:MAG: PrsW family intramembrane metalloprotease [Bacteroidales bacterium]|nr:PrsW family intramembrane metalloprotease [Bacteroidales bacterium]
MLYYLLLFSIAILPVVVLMVFIYRQDKYQKEPIKSLLKAFIGGIIAIPLDILFVNGIDFLLGNTTIANTVFFSAFLEAGIPEELCKFLIFMIFIWRDKNFDEYFDGIVYATFIGLGFACVENIGYVFQYGFSTGVVRALLSVPGHFLFGVVMGYFLSMAKFHAEKRGRYLWSGLLLAMLAHGLFDWLLMIANFMPIIGGIIYIVFIWGDIKLWKLGLKYINKQQENSRKQAQEAMTANMDYQISPTDTGYDSEYKQIDWNAGNRQ